MDEITRPETKLTPAPLHAHDNHNPTASILAYNDSHGQVEQMDCPIRSKDNVNLKRISSRTTGDALNSPFSPLNPDISIDLPLPTCDHDIIAINHTSDIQFFPYILDKNQAAPGGLAGFDPRVASALSYSAKSPSQETPFPIPLDQCANIRHLLSRQLSPSNSSFSRPTPPLISLHVNDSGASTLMAPDQVALLNWQLFLMQHQEHYQYYMSQLHLLRAGTPNSPSAATFPGSSSNSLTPLELSTELDSISPPENLNSNKVENMEMGQQNDGSGRRKRSKVTAEQLSILQQSFAENSLPSSTFRQELADQLGMTARSVQVWFQNNRSKIKKQNYPFKWRSKGVVCRKKRGMNKALKKPASCHLPTSPFFESTFDTINHDHGFTHQDETSSIKEDVIVDSYLVESPSDDLGVDQFLFPPSLVNQASWIVGEKSDPQSFAASTLSSGLVPEDISLNFYSFFDSAQELSHVHGVMPPTCGDGVQTVFDEDSLLMNHHSFSSLFDIQGYNLSLPDHSFPTNMEAFGTDSLSLPSEGHLENHAHPEGSVLECQINDAIQGDYMLPSMPLEKQE